MPHPQYRAYLFAYLVIVSFALDPNKMPEDFTDIQDIDNTIIVEIRYFSDHNFVGSRVNGYNAPRCLLTKAAAQKLSTAQYYLMNLKPSLFLKVYDCYRPQMASDFFVEWANNSDTKMKDEFYPDLEKIDIFPDWVASKSGHSRGSTIDLTIVPYPAPEQETYTNGMELKKCYNPINQRFLDNSIDMGTGFDCFSPLAHTFNTNISQEQLQNRYILKSAMEDRGFINYQGEWWHYTLQNEPYNSTYFNFPIMARDTSIPFYVLIIIIIGLFLLSTLVLIVILKFAKSKRYSKYNLVPN